MQWTWRRSACFARSTPLDEEAVACFTTLDTKSSELMRHTAPRRGAARRLEHDLRPGRAGSCAPARRLASPPRPCAVRSARTPPPRPRHAPEEDLTGAGPRTPRRARPLQSKAASTSSRHAVFWSDLRKPQPRGGPVARSAAGGPRSPPRPPRRTVRARCHVHRPRHLARALRVEGPGVQPFAR